MKSPPSSHSRQAGYSLITTLVLTAAATIVLGATLTRTLTGSKLNDRNNQYQIAGAAAEAATEKVLSRMAVDFANGGEQLLSNNLPTYRGLVPTAAENPYWNNFQFSDGQGNPNSTFVLRETTNASLPYTALLTQYPGLNAFSATYRVLSNVRPAPGTTYGNYNFTNAVQQDIQLAEIPIFQFAIFYNSLLEFSDCAPLTVNGRVHCNTNIYVGCLSSSSLTFNYFVTSSGIITNPACFGYAQSQWAGPVNYNGTPSPGWSTGEPVLTLPVGTNNTPAAVREIINPSPAGEGSTNPVSAQRYYNKASMRVELWGTNAADTYTNIIVGVSTNVYVNTNAISVTIKNSMYDTAPIVLSNGPAFSPRFTNWCNYNIDTNNFHTNGQTNAWLNTVLNFYDQREYRTNHTTQIDIGKLGSWIGNIGGTTNTNCITKWAAGNPFNGVIYVNDMRFTNSTWMDCVRLTNGVNVTNGLYAIGCTIATPNPLYVWGNYNCPNPAFLQSSNTTASRPCSFACDAVTMLSPNWTDSQSTASYTARVAADLTVNSAIIAGNVPSTDSSSTGFSGGVHNLPRLLEDWSSSALCINTSIINLYNSVQATKQFQAPGIYYKPPTRKFLFDLNFTTSSGLPPGTPLVDRMIRATWCNPPPNNVTYAPSPTLLYVPR